jgi:hypothetical protein
VMAPACFQCSCLVPDPLALSALALRAQGLPVTVLEAAMMTACDPVAVRSLLSADTGALECHQSRTGLAAESGKPCLEYQAYFLGRASGV